MIITVVYYYIIDMLCISVECLLKLVHFTGTYSQGWGQVLLTKYSSTSSTPNIYQVQVLVKYSFF